MRRLEVVVLRLGQEADVAEVDAQHRVSRSRGSARRRAGSCRRRRRRAPARSPPLGSSVGAISTVVAVGLQAEVGGLARRAAGPRCRARSAPCRSARATSRASSRPVCATAGRGGSPASRLLVVTGPPSHPAPPAAAAPTTTLWMSSSASVGGPRRSHRKNSTLPDGPGSGLVADGPRAPAQRCGRARPPRAPSRRAAPGRGPRRPCRAAPCRSRTAA